MRPWIWGLGVGLVVAAGLVSLEGAALSGFMILCALALGVAVVRLNHVVLALRFALDARDQVAAELQHQEARWSSVVNNSTDMIALLDESTSVKWVSPVVQDMLGYPPEEFVGNDIFKLIHEDDYDVVAEAYTAPMRMEARSLEMRLRHKSGVWRWLEVRGVSLLQDPDVEAIVISARDVTDRKQAEEALRASEERFRELAETVREVFYIHSADGELLYVSPAYESIWDRSRASLYEAPDSWQNAIHPEDASYVQEMWEDGRFKEPVDYRIVVGGGQIRWISDRTFPITDAEGNVVRVLGTAEDITERKLAQQGLIQLEEFERSILDSLSAHVGVLDGDGTIISINKAWDKFAHLVGTWASSASLGANMLRALRDSVEREPSYELSMALEGLESVLAGRRESFFIEYAVQTADGERWFAMHVSPLRGERGGAVVSLLDVTERMHALGEKERLTEQLRQSQKLEAIGRLAGGIAHDFNNVLAVIQNYACFLIEDMDPNDPKLQDVREILSAGERAGKLVQQLLTFSRKEIIKPEVLDLNLVIADYGKFLRSAIGEDITLEMELDPDIPSVLLDSGHLGQVLTNLAVNGRDAMPNGGRLTIKSSRVAQTQDDAEAIGAEREFVRLEVRDTGCGMSQKVLEHIFEPFFTTKERGQGTGLGLATVYGIVSQAGGRIDVKSAPDEGTIFVIHFPAAEADDDLLEVVKMKAEGTSSGETVLVVEDENGVRRMVERILSGNGYTVLTAASGEEALHIIENIEYGIDLLLTDVVMPRMSGKELADHMAELRPHTKAIFMSGYTDEIIARRGRLNDEEVLLEKPFSAEDLLRAVRRAVEATHV